MARPGAFVAFAKRDVVAPGYDEAVAAARESGFDAVLRLAGGRAAIFHEGTIEIGHARPDHEPRAHIHERFADTAGRVAAALRALGDGQGADVVVDAAGASAALQHALRWVRPGGQVTKVGWGPQPAGFSLDPLVQKAVTLQGSFSHNWPSATDQQGGAAGRVAVLLRRDGCRRAGQGRARAGVSRFPIPARRVCGQSQAF
jgi:NADPH:quinone reductase-like Zn-dependent oxidoreductase